MGREKVQRRESEEQPMVTAFAIEVCSEENFGKSGRGWRPLETVRSRTQVRGEVRFGLVPGAGLVAEGDYMRRAWKTGPVFKGPLVGSGVFGR